MRPNPEVMSEVVGYAKRVNEWMKSGGREQLAAKLKIAQPAGAS